MSFVTSGRTGAPPEMIPQSKPVKAVLLAAGLGTRLRPLTERVPKCLVEIGGQPLLQYWFDALEDAGVRDVLINTHHFADQVHAYLDTQRARGFEIRESHEPELLGSAGTLAANADWADDAESVLVIYPDNFSDVDLSALIQIHKAGRHAMTMLLFRCDTPSQCGIATQAEDGRIIDFVEKPNLPASDLANGGIYVISQACWREIVGLNVFDIGFDVLPKMLGRMHGVVHSGMHFDVGNQESLERARRLAELHGARQEESESWKCQ